MSHRDRNGFRRIYQEHAPGVTRHMAQLVGHSDAIEDLVSETFMRAFCALPRFERRSSIGTWLHGIAFNVARNYRETTRRRAALLEAQPQAGLRPVGEENTPEDDLSAREAADEFYRGLDALPDLLREAFVLRVLQCRPLDEAAKLIGVTLATVSNRARRAERLLKERFNAPASRLYTNVQNAPDCGQPSGTLPAIGRAGHEP